MTADQGDRRALRQAAGLVDTADGVPPPPAAQAAPARAPVPRSERRNRRRSPRRSPSAAARRGRPRRAPRPWRATSARRSAGRSRGRRRRSRRRSPSRPVRRGEAPTPARAGSDGRCRAGPGRPRRGVAGRFERQRDRDRLDRQVETTICAAARSPPARRARRGRTGRGWGGPASGRELGERERAVPAEAGRGSSAGASRSGRR